MNRAQLEHAIRAACSIADVDHVIIVGSQSILATWDEDELPLDATASREADILPDVADHKVEFLSDLIEGAAGELSLFDETHGFYLDGVDNTTAILPDGWRDRLVVVQGPGTTGVGETVYAGLCLDPVDCCVSKLCAFREKDRRFVLALVNAGLVTPDSIITRLSDVPSANQTQVDNAISWLRSIQLRS